MCYFNDFRCESGDGTVTKPAINICAQSQEFCMSALWMYLSNSTSLVVENLYHKLYAITDVIVDLTPIRGTNKRLLINNNKSASPSLSQYTSMYMICISM